MVELYEYKVYIVEKYAFSSMLGGDSSEIVGIFRDYLEAKDYVEAIVKLYHLKVTYGYDKHDLGDTAERISIEGIRDDFGNDFQKKILEKELDENLHVYEQHFEDEGWTIKNQTLYSSIELENWYTD